LEPNEAPEPRGQCLERRWARLEKETTDGEKPEGRETGWTNGEGGSEAKVQNHSGRRTK